MESEIQVLSSFKSRSPSVHVSKTETQNKKQVVFNHSEYRLSVTRQKHHLMSLCQDKKCFTFQKMELSLMGKETDFLLNTPGLHAFLRYLLLILGTEEVKKIPPAPCPLGFSLLPCLFQLIFLSVLGFYFPFLPEKRKNCYQFIL